VPRKRNNSVSLESLLKRLKAGVRAQRDQIRCRWESTIFQSRGLTSPPGTHLLLAEKAAAKIDCMRYPAAASISRL